MSPSDKNLVKILLYVLGFAVMYCVTIPLYYDGGYNVLEKKSLLYLMAQNKKADSDISDFSNKIFNIKSVYKEYQNISQSSKDKINSVILEDLDILRTLYDLDELVKDNGLSMLSLPKYSIGRVSKDSPIRTYNFSMSFTGDYFKFLDFLNNLNNSLQVYKIKSLTLSKDETKTDYNFELVLESYEIINK